MTVESFDQWAILELIGHVRLAGRVTEEEHFGAKLGRIDIPNGDGFTTQYFSGGSIYRLTPTTEEIARQVARSNQPQPVHRWELPAPATGPVVTTGHYDDLDDDERGYREADDREDERDDSDDDGPSGGDEAEFEAARESWR